MLSTSQTSDNQMPLGSHSAAGGFSAVMNSWEQDATEMLLEPRASLAECTQITCELMGRKHSCRVRRIGQLLWRSSRNGVVTIQSTAVTYSEQQVRLKIILHSGEEGTFHWPIDKSTALVVSLQEEDAARLACWILCNTFCTKIAVSTHAHVHTCRNPFCGKQHLVHEILAYKDNASNFLYDSKATTFAEANVKDWIETKKPTSHDICFPEHARTMGSNDMVICKQLRVMDKTIAITSLPKEIASLLKTRVPREKKFDAKLILQPDRTSPLLVRRRIRPNRIYSCSTETVGQWTGYEPFGCVSYVWAQYTQDSELKNDLQRLSQISAIDLWWVDRWCINQSDAEDKMREMPRMRDYYSGAEVTAVLMPDVTLRMAEVPEDSEVFNAVWTRNQNSQLLSQVCGSRWAQRLWTLQEGVLARKTLVLTQKQCLPGSLLDLLLDSEYCPTEESAWATIEPMGPLEPMLHGSCAWWNRGKMCIKQPLFGREYSQWWGSNTAIRRDRMYSAEVLGVASSRNCAIEADRIYGIAGLIKGGDRLNVDYSMEPDSLIAHAVEIGVLGLEVLMTTTVSLRKGRCWAPYQLHDLTTYSGSWRLRGMEHDVKVTAQGLLVKGHLVVREEGLWKTDHDLQLEDWRGCEYRDGLYLVLSICGQHNIHIAVHTNKVTGNIIYREKSVVVKATNMPEGSFFYIGSSPE